MTSTLDGATRTTSRDGTEIAWWTTGEGPPLVVVHGAPADHTRWRPLLPYLEPRRTVHALDRRGRGASGDGEAYALEREFEDVAAVVDAVSESAGAPVDVYGHSFGGLCAFGAAARTTRVGRLALYEGWPAATPGAHALPDDAAARLDEHLAAGDREAVVETVLRELAGVSDDDLAELRTHPSWQARVDVAHTLPRELRALASAALDPAEAARISAPTLLLVGSRSTDPAAADVEAVAAALGDARIVTLDGQEHVADALAPEVFARHLLGFLDGD